MALKIAIEALEQQRVPDDKTPAESDYESMNHAWFSKDRTEMDDRYIVGFAEGIQIGRRQKRAPEGHILISKTLLDEIELTLRHAQVFTKTREKMHPDGQELYDECLAAVQAYLLTTEPEQDND